MMVSLYYIISKSIILSQIVLLVFVFNSIVLYPKASTCIVNFFFQFLLAIRDLFKGFPWINLTLVKLRNERSC